MKQIKSLTIFLLLLFLWFSVNIVQSIFTEITNDEAYYALWGKHLDWGYYDHPPMVALYSYLSSFFFQGNLGVRFMSVVMQLITLMLIWKTIKLSNTSNVSVIRFFAVTASIVMFSAYGFILTPDAPLLFFIALFLYLYDSFLRHESWGNVIGLGISIAGMMYSKYHAVLLLLLVVLSNIRLLSNYKSWIAAAVAIILLLPHIYWQVQAGFPGFQYHLSDRSAAFEWRFLIAYWPNQLAVFNPFTLVAVVWALFSAKSKDIFARTLKIIIVGFLVFFAFMTFRGHVEPHWTIAASVAMIILVMRESETNIRLAIYIKKFVYPSLCLVFIARFLLLTDWLPQQLAFHGKESKYQALGKIAGDYPVIFTGSFQAPSLYHFFTGKQTQVISSLYSRKTQFDLWKFEENFYNQPVFVTGNYPGRSQMYQKAGYSQAGFFTDSLQVTNHIVFDLKEIEYEITPKGQLTVEAVIRQNSKADFNLNHSVFPAKITGIFISKEGEMSATPVITDFDHVILKPNEEKEVRLRLPISTFENKEGKLALGLKSFFGLTQNSSFIPIKNIP